MAYKAENPCAGVAGASEMVLLGGSTDFENSQLTRKLQVARLTRRAAISAAMAAIIAPHAFGEAA